MKDDKASSTAFSVLQGILYVAQHKSKQALTPTDQAEACRYILQQSEQGLTLLKQLQYPFLLKLIPLIERLSMPGFTLHYVLRKRFIEDSIRHALADGATQIVNIGAGFDTLAWRLHTEFPSATFIEIDHPATSVVKKDALVEKGDNLHLIAVDLSEKSVESVLGSSVFFDTSRKTAYICEGVLMYLDESVVCSLFQALKNLTGSGSTFVFTALASMKSKDTNVGLLLKLYLKFKSEPVNWSIEPNQIEDFVKQQGYILEAQANDAHIIKGYDPEGQFSDLLLHKGEFEGVAIVP